MQEDEKLFVKILGKQTFVCLAKCKIETRIFEMELILKKTPAERPKARCFFRQKLRKNTWE
jgi:hypothetical protein